MKKLFLILITFLISNPLFAVNREAYNWLFSGYNFKDATYQVFMSFDTVTLVPSIRVDSLLKESFGNCFYSMISDSLANKLFYTFGNNVYNKNNNFMISKDDNYWLPNIIKKPGINNNYYLAFNSGELYHFKIKEINMDLNNGLGGYVSSPIDKQYGFGSLQTAFKHANGNDLWILYAARINTSSPWIIYSLLITKDTIISVENIISSTDVGRLRASPDGSRLAMININEFNIYDFNNITGIISNKKTINLTHNKLNMMDIEWSPRGNNLFVSNCTTDSVFIEQYQAFYKTKDRIVNSRKLILNNIISRKNYLAGGMQLAPDGKIYYITDTYSQFLGSIEFPNKVGKNVEMIDSSVNLKGYKFETQFLPLFPPYLFGKPYSIITSDIICSGDTLFLTTNSVSNASYNWKGPNGFTSLKSNPVIPNANSNMTGTYYLQVSNFGTIYNDSLFIAVFDPSLVSISHTATLNLCENDPIQLSIEPDYPGLTYHWSTGETNRTKTVKNSGTYTGYAELDNGCKGSAKVEIIHENPLISIKGDTSICFGDTTILSVSPNLKQYKYIWSTGDTTSSIKVFKPGFYSVGMNNTTGCTANKTIKVTQMPKLQVSILGEKSLCNLDSLILKTQPDNNSYDYKWSSGDTTNSIIVTKPGNYTVDVSTKSGCSGSASFSVTNKGNLDVQIIQTTGLCPGDFTILKTNITDSSYHWVWSSGERIPIVIIYSPGTYWVKVSNDKGCTGSATYTVTVAQLPVVGIRAPDKNSFCAGDSVLLIAEPYDFSYKYSWSTGDSTNYIIVKNSGRYTLTAENSDGCKDSATVEIKVNSKPDVKISGSSYLCKGDSLILQSNKDFAQYQWSTGDTTKSITISKADKYILNIIDENGCSGSDSMIVTVNPNPTVKILGDTSFCEGSTLQLSANNNFLSYKWNTGETTKAITINQPGQYILTAQNEFGCIGSDTLIVKLLSTNLSLSDNIIDFGKNKLKSTITKTIKIKNDGTNKIEIKQIIIDGKDYKLINPVPPLTLAVGEEKNLTVSFNPNELGNYPDSLIIQIDKPCKKQYSLKLSGLGAAKLYVWLPDTTALVGYPDFHIALKAKLDADTTINLSYKSDVRLIADVYKPVIGFVSEKYDNIDRIISVEGKNQSLNQNESKLSEFSGLILLGMEDSTYLIIDKFEYDSTYLDIEKKNGMLRLTGVCRKDLNKIKFLISPAIDLSPNPVIDHLSLNIESLIKTDARLIITNVLGSKVFDLNENIQIGNYSRNIDVSSFPSGFYNIVVQIDGDTRYMNFIKH